MTSLNNEIFEHINDFQYIKRIIEIIDPNHKIFTVNFTIMHMSIYSDDIKIVEMVLDAGGDPNIEDIHGTNPTDLCIFLKKNSKFFKLLKSRGGKLKNILKI